MKTIINEYWLDYDTFLGFDLVNDVVYITQQVGTEIYYTNSLESFKLWHKLLNSSWLNEAKEMFLKQNIKAMLR